MKEVMYIEFSSEGKHLEHFEDIESCSSLRICSCRRKESVEKELVDTAWCESTDAESKPNLMYTWGVNDDKIIVESALRVWTSAVEELDANTHRFEVCFLEELAIPELIVGER